MTHTHVTERLRQEGHQFEVNLGYTVKPCLQQAGCKVLRGERSSPGPVLDGRSLVSGTLATLPPGWLRFRDPQQLGLDLSSSTVVIFLLFTRT